MTAGVQPIKTEEFQQRIVRAQALMRENNLKAIYVNAGTNLYYFTGTKWFASERLVGAIIPAEGEIEYIAPYFEVNTLNGFTQIKAKISAWQEDENPYQLVIERLQAMGIRDGQIGIDESAAFFIFDGLAKASSDYTYWSIIARELFKAPVSFKLQGTMIMCCNDLPTVSSIDGGTWRRIRVVEFKSRFCDNPVKENEFKIDPTIKYKIKSWRPYFMSILIHWYNKFLEEGINEPEEVTKEMRRKAKVINFGILYGMGTSALQKNLKTVFNT